MSTVVEERERNGATITVNRLYHPHHGDPTGVHIRIDHPARRLGESMQTAPKVLGITLSDRDAKEFARAVFAAADEREAPAPPERREP